MPTGFVSQSKRNKLRLVLSGLPMSGKTTSLGSFDPPHHIIVSPGEKGTASLPEGEGISTYIYDVDPEDRKRSYEIIKDFETLILDVAHSKDVYTLSLEGNHKLYDYYLDIATHGDYLSGKEFDSRLYGQAHRMYGDLLNTLFFCPVPVVIYTAWAELEYKDERLTKEERRNNPQYYYPKLPGQMAKAILGEVDGAIFATIRSQCSQKVCKEKKGGIEHYMWQLNPLGAVKGAGFKLPYGSEPLPNFIHGRNEQGQPTQDWQVLKKLLQERNVHC